MMPSERWFSAFGMAIVAVPSVLIVYMIAAYPPLFGKDVVWIALYFALVSAYFAFTNSRRLSKLSTRYERPIVAGLIVVVGGLIVAESLIAAPDEWIPNALIAGAEYAVVVAVILYIIKSLRRSTSP